MEKLTQKDAFICLFIGAAAGLLLSSVFINLDLKFNWLEISLGLSLFTLIGYMLGIFLTRWIPGMFQFVKYGIVGGFNAMLDFGILNQLIFLTGISAGLFYSLFKSISFLIAVVNSYFWNKYWTFNANTKKGAKEFFNFFILNIIGFVINVGLASLIVNFMKAPADIPPKTWANIGAACSAIIALLWNFVGMKFFVFKK